MGVKGIKKMVVVGAGTVGHGIAQVFAMRGYRVNLLDISEDELKEAAKRIEWSLNKFVEKRRIRREDAEATLSRIGTTTNYQEAMKDVDFAIEAVPEKMDLKKKVFAKIDELAPNHTIIASNTSALSITEMGRATKRGNRVVGMHWFNPPQLMQLIEVIKGDDTEDEIVDLIIELSKGIGKTPILCKKDVRGFIVNRMLGIVFNEAFWTYQRKETSKEGIDASAKYIGGFPMGWFELCDYVGIDIAYEVGIILHKAYGPRFQPCQEVIEPLIKEGDYGQKVGRGFYDWSKGRPRIPFQLADEYDIERSWAVAVNEASWLVKDGVAEPESIDTGMKFGTGWPQGPCEYADRKGLDWELKKLEELHKEYKMEMYNPSPLFKEYVEKGWTGRKTGRGFYNY
jgi:enoyl-CoA hydratase/3-hydroxyacyl-CoA dehydrogenase